MPLNIVLVEPYYGGSHQVWADGYKAHSQHQVQLLTLPAQFWKWRMQGGAVTLARLFVEANIQPDVILASDMMDVSLFRSITRRETSSIPIALYFHENQLSYFQNSRQRHGWQYGFINYASALSSEAIIFNSDYHLQNFFEELPRMLKHFADFNELQTVNELRARASVIPPGIDLRRFDEYEQNYQSKNTTPIILWNHRWEEDKNPQLFVDSLLQLASENIDFLVIFLGENFQQEPQEFIHAREVLGDRVLHYGYVESFSKYAQFLWQAHYVVSTAYQEFFGISVIEAIYCGCIPLLPQRLNYPYLLPESYHSDCLYARDSSLVSLLRYHLEGERNNVEIQRLQKHIAQYDWAICAKHYDDALEQLVATHS